MAVDPVQPFGEVIERGDLKLLLDLLDALPEADRPAVRELAVGRSDLWADQMSLTADACTIVLYATAKPRSASMAWVYNIEDRFGLIERLVRARPRRWRQAWANYVCSGEGRSVDLPWLAIRRLVLRGSIDRPEGELYVSRALAGFGYLEQRGGATMPEELRADLAFLGDELWNVFALSAPDFDERWRCALLQLADEGVIARDRLLDEILHAMRRNLRPVDARPLRLFYAQAAPSLDEHQARLDDLLALLAAPDGAVAGVALKALAELEQAGRLPVAEYLDSAVPAAVLPKVHAVRAVKLAGRLLCREPSVAADGVPLLAAALTHDAREVQTAAIEIVEQHAAGFDPASLADVAADVDPSLRARVMALTGAGQDAPAEPEPVSAFDPRADRLPGAEPLCPVTDLEDLLERVGIQVGHGRDADEIELLLDGLSRLRATQPEPRRAAALQAASLGGLVLDARGTLGSMVLRWLHVHGNPLARNHRASPPTHALAVEGVLARVRELHDDLADPEPRALLAPPTHRGGWIDPAVAVDRVAALGDRAPLQLDLAQLVLRLAPDGRCDALARAQTLRGEPAAILVRALGGPSARPQGDSLAPAWEAADQAADPDTHAPPSVRAADLDIQGSHRSHDTGAALRPCSPATAAAYPGAFWGDPRGSGYEAWLTRVWPARRDAAYAVVCRRLWVDTRGDNYGVDDALEPLLDLAEPVTATATLAVALALGAADVTARTMAADVAIAALGDGRLAGAVLGERFAELLRAQLIAAGVPREGYCLLGWEEPSAPGPKFVVPSRWATSLGVVASAGPRQRREVQDALEGLCGAAPADTKRFVGLVDLLRRLAVESGTPVRGVQARAWLQSLPPRTKGGRAAREALAIGSIGRMSGRVR